MTPASQRHPEHTRSPEEQRKLDAALRELFERQIRFNEVLGVKVVDLDPHAPQVRFPMRDELVGHFLYGRLHGGVISAVLDAMGGFAIMLALADKHRDEDAHQVMMRFARMGTIDLRIDFLRQGVGREFTASAKVTRLGGRIASTQMTLANEEGTLVATGAAAYIVS